MLKNHKSFRNAATAPAGAKKAYRELSFRANAKDDGSYDLSFATGNVVDMGFYKEALSLAGCNFEKLNNRAQLLFNHDRNIYIGVINSAWVDGNMAMANMTVGESERCKEFKKDIDAGILNKVSVGYYVNEESYDKDTDTYTALRWTPFEISIVTNPADFAVGLRSQEDKCQARFQKTLTNFKTRSTKMATEAEKAAEKAAQKALQAREAKAREAKEAEETRQASLNDAVLVERTRISKISAMATRLAVADEYRDAAIADGTSLVDFIENAPPAETRDAVLPGPRDTQEPTATRELVGEISTKDDDDVLGFRLGDVVRDMISHKRGTAYSRSFDMACSGGSEMTLPPGFMAREALLRDEIKQRASLISAPALVGNQVKSIVESLQDAIVLQHLGCRVNMGLVADSTLPVSNRTYEAQFAAPGTAVDGVDGTYAPKKLSPHRITLAHKVAKKQFLNTTTALENDLRSEMMAAVGRCWQNAVFSGDGTGENPTGITNTTGVATIAKAKFATAGLNKAVLIGIEAAPFINNVGPGMPAYVMSEQVLAVMVGQLLTVGEAKYLAEYEKGSKSSRAVLRGMTATGQEVYTTQSLPADAAGNVIFGHWDQVETAFWDNITFNVDATSNAVFQEGMVAFAIEAYADIVLLREKAFVTTSES